MKASVRPVPMRKAEGKYFWPPEYHRLFDPVLEETRLQRATTVTATRRDVCASDFLSGAGPVNSCEADSREVADAARRDPSWVIAIVQAPS